MPVKLIYEGKGQRREIPLPPTIFVIGRDPRCHLRPHCSLVSKFHCAIATWAGKVVVRDLKSANGTFVNDQRICSEIRVHDGDTVRIGTLHFTFAIQPNPDELLPLQVIRESEVKWLIDSPADEFALSPAETVITALPAAVRKRLAGAPQFATSGDQAGVSAGAYLRDYFHRH